MGVIAFVHRTRKVCDQAGPSLVVAFAPWRMSPKRKPRFSEKIMLKRKSGRSPEPVMPIPASQMSAGHDVIPMLDDAVSAVESLFDDATRAIGERVTIEGRTVSRVFDREQRATHGLAWLATYVEALRQLAAYAQRMAEMGAFGETEELLVRIGAGEYLAQIVGGIPMSQNEIVRLSDLGLSPAAVAARLNTAVEPLIGYCNTAQRRARLAELMRGQQDATVGATGLDDTLDAIRDEMR